MFMKNKGFCIIRVKRGNVVDIYSIATYDFIENNKERYDYSKSYICDGFEISENMGGQVFLKLYRTMKYSKVPIETTIIFKKNIIEEISIQDCIY